MHMFTFILVIYYITLSTKAGTPLGVDKVHNMRGLLPSHRAAHTRPVRRTPPPGGHQSTQETVLLPTAMLPAADANHDKFALHVSVTELRPHPPRRVIDQRSTGASDAGILWLVCVVV